MQKRRNSIANALGLHLLHWAVDLYRNTCIASLDTGHLFILLRGYNSPYSKDHVANMGPTWVLSAQGGPHVVPINLAIRDDIPEQPSGVVLDVFYATTMYWESKVPNYDLSAPEPKEEGIAPSLVGKPKAQTVVEGEDVVFEVKIVASPKPEVCEQHLGVR